MTMGMDTTKRTRIEEAEMNEAKATMVEVSVQAWSGNVRPWRATVRVAGRFAGRTGFCSSRERAHRAGVEMGHRAMEAQAEAVEERKNWEAER